ncbi:Hpt domain protein [Anatilimnocola aggregata]|uniref:Hpt domain protein n=1 Tax=Anatilimnocola aggregata TaxID=2528021 RepID=A0A517YK08_9BACT|nr:Hpt domain-containing protein [Anatilimnocola aggregata]QDU30555.1 Hpt domain protein [Anatilimnocola aggregata]
MSPVETAKADDCYYSPLCEDADLTELVQQFVDELPSRIVQLHHCLDDRQWSNLARYAHQLKGAGGSYGFPQITPVAARLELLAKQFADELAIRSALDDLVIVISKIRAGTVHRQ